MPSALFPPPDPPQNHAKAPPEGCSLGHRTVVICGCCRGLFWKRPSPYCGVLRIWGGVWMPIGWHRGLFLQKPRAVNKNLFLPLWVLYKITYRTSHLAPRPLPKSAKHDSTVTGASKTDYPQIRKSPQYGGQELWGGDLAVAFLRVFAFLCGFGVVHKTKQKGSGEAPPSLGPPPPPQKQGY